MRRLKWLSLVLFSGLLSLLLPSISLVSNASALKITDYRRFYIRYIDFSTQNPSNTYTTQSIQEYVNSIVYTANIPSNKTFKASGLTIRTYESVSYNKDDNWDLTLYLYTFMDSYRGLDGETLIPNAICPAFSSDGNLIDTCDIEYHDMVDSPIDLTHLDITTPSPGVDYAVQNKIHGYYSIKLKGHFTSNGSGNAMKISGPFLAVFNPTSQTLPINYIIGFSTFRVYQEVPDEDKAAEELDEMNQKDDQDRSDIESQSSNIDSSGESSQQSAENTGTTLLAAFSSFVTAITSASPSNCNIDMDLGNLDLGIVNFCTLSPPPEFQVLGSIFLILFCVPLSIATARKVISLFRSFQG